MKITVQNKKGLEKDIKVLIDKSFITKQLDEKYEEIKKDVVLKGFRPGKVPTEILKRQFGKAVYGEVIDKVLKETTTKALQDNKIKPAGQPKIDLKSFGEGKDLEYVISVTELPKLNIKSFENITFEEYSVKIEDKEIDKRIDQIAKTQNKFKDTDDKYVAKNGDSITFDYEATVNEKEFKGNVGKGTQIVLGKDLFIKGFDSQLVGVKWEITQLPGFDKLYDDLTDLVSTAKRTYVKTKDDKKFREFYDEIRVIRNKVRTHLRNEYPDQYKRITRIGESELNEMIDLVHVMEPDGSLYGTGQVVGVENDKTIVRFDGETVKRFPSNRVVPVQEEEVDEVSLSNAAGAYLTPYAFRKKGQKPNDEVYKELGFEPVKEGDTYEKMAAKGKKAGNLKQGTVRKRLNIPKGEKIPLSKIKKEISRIKKMENPSEKNKKYLKALNLAKTLKTTTNVNEDKNPGATLGPGPKAGPDGVDDNYYVKAFKYKLVPKKNGTYVQKGSGLEVKKLF